MSEENWTSKMIKYSITLLEQNLVSHNFISNQIYVMWKKTPKHCIENTSVSYFILKHNKNNGDITTGTTNWVSTRGLLCSKCFCMFPCLSLQCPNLTHNESEADRGQQMPKVLSRYEAALPEIQGFSDVKSSCALPMSVFPKL